MKIRIATKPHAPKESSFQEFDAREPNVNESHLEVAPMKDPVDTAETFETGEYKVAEMTVAETFPPVASTAPKVVKRAAADESLKNRRHIITIVGSIVFVVLSVFLWLSVKFKGAIFARSKRKFFREFYEANRAVLRETYLRYPEGQRSVGGAEQSWSVLLSVMAVRFAQQQAEAGEKLTDYAQYILKAVDENAQDENQKNAYAFLPDLDKKIRNDCRAFTQEFLTQSSEMDTAIHDGLLA